MKFKFCPHCGAKNSINSNFCTRCGVRLDTFNNFDSNRSNLNGISNINNHNPSSVNSTVNKQPKQNTTHYTHVKSTSDKHVPLSDFIISVIGCFIIFLCFGGVHHVFGFYTGSHTVPIELRNSDNARNEDSEIKMHYRFISVHNEQDLSTTNYYVKRIVPENDARTLIMHTTGGPHAEFIVKRYGILGWGHVRIYPKHVDEYN